jgi:hypothetical protein
MMERRNVLKACLAASVFPLVGCSDSGDGSTQGTPPPAPAPAPANLDSPSSTGIPELEIQFKGLAFFVFDKSKTSVDIGLPKAADPHYSTLRIPRVAVSHKSTAAPVAADEQYVYFNLTGTALNVVPRDSDDPSTWTSVRTADLVVGMDEISNHLPSDCGTSNWNTVKWLIDFKKDLYPDAVLASDWKDRLAGRIELTHGYLESGFGDDGMRRYTYEMTDTNGNKKRRLAKDVARYRVKSNFVEFQLHGKSCIVDTRKRYIDPDARPLPIAVEHVPGMWMDVTQDLTDYLALYDLMDAGRVGKLAGKPVPGGRQACAGSSGATAGCQCCPVAGMFI